MLTRLRDDRGAVAVVTAICALMLMGFGAVAVDLGNAWARKRAIQTTADLAALAGASGLPDVQAARTLAARYLDKNRQPIGSADLACPQSLGSRCWDNDDDYTNGEIDFYGPDANHNGRFEQSELTTPDGQAVAIRVVPPWSRVDFGLAGAVGVDRVSVTEAATAAIGSPYGLGIPPFYLTVNDNGPTCIKDESPGGGGGSPPAGTPVDPCLGPSSNRGYVDEPRYAGTQFIEHNIKEGLDHTPHEYQRYPLGTDTYGPPYDDGVVRAAPATGVECGSLPAALVFQSGSSTPVQDINCARLKSGNTGGQLKPGLFDTSSSSPGRLLQRSCGRTGTSGPVAGVDETPLSDFVNPGLGTDPASPDYDELVAYVTAHPSISPSDPKAGWISGSVLDCPRFAILPVLNATVPPPNGTTYYPIIGFKAAYFWDDSSDHGFGWQGSSLRVVRAFVFDLDFLPPQVSGEVAGRIGDYLGSGPKVVQLVHDSDDPAT